MEICEDKRHGKIVYEGSKWSGCPACEALDKLEQEIEDHKCE